MPSLSVCTTLRVYRTPATGKNRTSVEGDDKKSGLFFHYFIVNIAGGCHERGEGGNLLVMKIIPKQCSRKEIKATQLVSLLWM